MEKHYDFNFMQFAHKIMGIIIDNNLNEPYYKTNNIEEMAQTECLTRFAFYNANMPDIRNKNFFEYLEEFYNSNKEIATEFIKWPTTKNKNNIRFHVGDRIKYNNETYFVDRISPCGTYINAHPTNTDFVDAFRNHERIRIESKDWNAIVIRPYSKDEMKAFDKVIARDNDNYWKCATFSHHTDNNQFVTSALTTTECVPYNEYTEYLIGQNVDYNGFFKT